MDAGEFEYTQILDCRDGRVLVEWAPTWCKITDVNNVAAAKWACPKPADLGACRCAANNGELCRRRRGARGAGRRRAAGRPFLRLKSTPRALPAPPPINPCADDLINAAGSSSDDEEEAAPPPKRKPGRPAGKKKAASTSAGGRGPLGPITCWVSGGRLLFRRRGVDARSASGFRGFRGFRVLDGGA